MTRVTTGIPFLFIYVFPADGARVVCFLLRAPIGLRARQKKIPNLINSPIINQMSTRLPQICTTTFYIKLFTINISIIEISPPQGSTRL